MLLHGSVLLCGEEEGGVDGPTSDPVSASDGPGVRLASFFYGVISLLFLLKLPLGVPPYRIVNQLDFLQSLSLSYHVPIPHRQEALATSHDPCDGDRKSFLFQP